MTVDEIHDVSKIDHWFLRRLERVVKFSKKMEVCTCVQGSPSGGMYVCTTRHWESSAIYLVFAVSLFLTTACPGGRNVSGVLPFYAVHADSQTLYCSHEYNRRCCVSYVPLHSRGVQWNGR